MSDEPEVQHRDECEHPIAPCTCPRDDLLSEARRIREMCLFAEGEFARENRRAVDLKIERDRMQRALDDWERVVTEKALLDAGKVAWYEAVVPALEAERDRLQAAVDAALKLADAKIEGEAEREADAWVTLGAALGQLDVSPTGENDDVEALADRVAGLPPTEQVDVLLGMLGKVSDERDRLRTVVWDQSKLRGEAWLAPGSLGMKR